MAVSQEEQAKAARKLVLAAKGAISLPKLEKERGPMPGVARRLGSAGMCREGALDWAPGWADVGVAGASKSRAVVPAPCPGARRSCVSCMGSCGMLRHIGSWV